MADKAVNTKNQVKEITDRLEEGVKNLFTGEKYLHYLKTMSRFHRYSTRNTVLIYMQKPDATLVAGYQAWQSKFGRYVKRGETGIKILAPTPFTIKKEQQKLDPDTRRPIIGSDGLPVTEEVEVRIARFKVIPVFDVSQTDGKPLPSLVEDLTGDVKHYELFLDALRAVSPLPIRFETMEPGTDGVCRMGDSIGIRTSMSEVQTISAVIHEITHAKLHDLERLQQEDETAKPKDRRTEEVEAESVSYAVCQYYGIETAPNSFGYLAEWSKTRELKELNASLDIIRKTAAELIDSIDENFRTLAKERGIDLTPKEPDVAMQAPETDIAVPLPTPSSPTEEQAKTEKPYELGYGHMGNGLTVWNRLEEKDGDYVTVAHIAPDRTVTFYDKDMPDTVKAQIEKTARTTEMNVSATQHTPVFNTPPESALQEQDTPEKLASDLHALMESYDPDAYWNYTDKGELDTEGMEQAVKEDRNAIAVGGKAFEEIKQYLSDITAELEESPELHNLLKVVQDLQHRLTAYAQQHHRLGNDDIKPAAQQAGQEITLKSELDPDELFPDPAISLSERDLFGYTDSAMLPLLKDRAVALYDADHTIYMLYPDNTEAMVFEREEMDDHKGIFGIEAKEWQSSREYAEMKNAIQISEASKEAGLLYGEGNRFGIYQLKSGDELHYHRWAHFDELQKDGLTIDRANYELVYTALLTEGTTLGDIVRIFNIDHPADFRGHSLSTSDIVVLKKDSEIKSYYDDGGPFVELLSFLGNETQPEIDPVMELAARLDEFADDFDPYGYRDEVEDREENIRSIARDIENGDLSGMKEMLQYAIEEETQAQEAAALLEQLTAYEKPEPSAPTVSELEEQVKTGKQISLLDLANAVKKDAENNRHKEKPSILARLKEEKQAAQSMETSKSALKRNSEREV